MSNLPFQIARWVSPKRALAVLCVFVAGFALLGFIQSHFAHYNLQAFDLKDSDLDARISMPATFTSILFALSALLALSLSHVDKRSREARWRRVGWLFAALALEELFGIHTWLEDRGVPWAVSYLPLLAIAAALWFPALRMLGRQPRTQALFTTAVVTWLVAGVFDATVHDRAHAFSGIEIFEMTAGAFFLSALLARAQYLARAYHPIDEVETRSAPAAIAVEALGRIRLRPVAIVMAVVTALLAIQYVLLHTGNYHGAEKAPVLDLNNEQTIWATLQGSIIWAAAGLSFVAGLLGRTRPPLRRWWVTLGFVLLILGADEVIAIHDRFQDATGHPGQIILAPVALVGIVAWWKVLQEIWDNRTVRILFIAGAAFWAFSQASDIILNPILRWTITPEEVGETTGSSLWMFGLLIWLRSALEPAPPSGERAYDEHGVVRVNGPNEVVTPVTAGERATTG